MRYFQVLRIHPHLIPVTLLPVTLFLNALYLCPRPAASPSPVPAIIPIQSEPTTTDQPQLVARFGSGATVTALAFTGEGDLLLSGRADGAVMVWDVATQAPLRQLSLKKGHITFAPDGSLAANAYITAPDRPGRKVGEPEVALWDLQTGEEKCKFRPFLENPMLGAQVTALAFSPDAHILAVAVGALNLGGVQLWDTDKGIRLRTLQEISGDMQLSYGVAALAFAPDGKTLAANDFISLKANPKDAKAKDVKAKPYRGPAVGLWNVQTGQWRTSFQGSRPLFCFSHDGKTLAAASQDRKVVQLWNLSTGKIIKTLPGANATIVPLAFTPDDESLWCSSKGLKRWNVHTGALMQSVPYDPKVTRSVISPDGTYVARGLETGSIELWRTSPP